MGGLIDAYAVLGVAPDADAATLKAAHRRLVREHHPDLADPANRDAATRRLQEINVAYGLLRDPATRAAYDAARRGGGSAAASDDLTWDDLAVAAGRWAGRWWRRHRGGTRRDGLRAMAGAGRLGRSTAGRVLWLVSCACWTVGGLMAAVAGARALQALGIDATGPVAPVVGAVVGALVGNQRGWQRRLRLARLPWQPRTYRMAPVVGAAVLLLGIGADAVLAGRTG